MNIKQIKELTNGELIKIVQKMENRNRRFNQRSPSKVQPYVDEYQRRLLDGRVTGSIDQEVLG